MGEKIELCLRDVRPSDLAVFFQQQRDREACVMAAFTTLDPDDEIAFITHWQKIMKDTSNILQTIYSGDEIYGNIVCYTTDGHKTIGYWIGKEYWGVGIASKALSVFLELLQHRPVYAWCAQDNKGSLSVLRKNGFKNDIECNSYSEARQCNVAEYRLICNE